MFETPNICVNKSFLPPLTSLLSINSEDAGGAASVAASLQTILSVDNMNVNNSRFELSPMQPPSVSAGDPEDDPASELGGGREFWSQSAPAVERRLLLLDGVRAYKSIKRQNCSSSRLRCAVEFKMQLCRLRLLQSLSSPPVFRLCLDMTKEPRLIHGTSSYLRRWKSKCKEE